MGAAGGCTGAGTTGPSRCPGQLRSPRPAGGLPRAAGAGPGARRRAAGARQPAAGSSAGWHGARPPRAHQRVAPVPPSPSRSGPLPRQSPATAVAGSAKGQRAAAAPQRQPAPVARGAAVGSAGRASSCRPANLCRSPHRNCACSCTAGCTPSRTGGRASSRPNPGSGSSQRRAQQLRQTAGALAANPGGPGAALYANAAVPTGPAGAPR